jgi:hypothetical protein
MRRIKLTSDEGEFSIDRIEEQLFKNKFDNDSFDPKLMTDRQRGIYIKMLKMQTPMKDHNMSARVGDAYPRYNRKYMTMNSIEKREF